LAAGTNKGTFFSAKKELFKGRIFKSFPMSCSKQFFSGKKVKVRVCQNVFKGLTDPELENCAQIAFQL
jgi:hypothetical protein